MQKIKYTLIFLILGGLCIFWLYSRPLTCKFPSQERLTIATVDSSSFVEFIPLTGKAVPDNVNGVKVDIDQMYSGKIAVGLNATTQIRDSIYTLRLTRLFPDVVNGRFTAELNFDDPKAPIKNDERIRIRLELGKPTDALVVPVGRFYYETKGKWMYVIDRGIAMRRSVRLGRKNTECFEVLDGLNAGEQVITSSYEIFKNKDSVFLTLKTE